MLNVWVGVFFLTVGGTNIDAVSARAMYAPTKEACEVGMAAAKQKVPEVHGLYVEVELP